MKRALITGISGQVAHYLKDLLLDKNYQVDGTMHIPGCTPELELLEQNQYDEVYVLHHVRHQPGKSWSEQYQLGTMNGIAILERAKGAHVVFAGSILQGDEMAPPTPWLTDRRALAEVVKNFRTEDRTGCLTLMPHLWQYVSARGNPTRQYLMRVLHEIAGGVEPAPLAPEMPVCVGHARDAARFLYGLLTQTTAYQTARYRGHVKGFVESAKDPDSWLGQIVREIQDDRTAALLTHRVEY